MPPAVTSGRRAFARVSAVAVQVALLVAVVHRFHLESRGFLHLLLLTLAGFPLHAALPPRYRPPFFLLLSLAGVALVVGPGNAAVVVAVGVLLVGLCHLPIPWRGRYALLLAAGAVLACGRVGAVELGVPAAVWPILASMFMFRLVVYLYDLRYSRLRTTPAWSLSYFFLLPNVCFPLFPVVDFKKFLKGRERREPGEEHRVYQRGARWMLRGVFQLILYRYVYQRWTLDPAAVSSAVELLRFIVTSFLLYLRVSGQFHLVVGILLLFGFDLPETHHRYFLASSFTDFWRRINIYWRDFLAKVFFFPIHDRLRRRGVGDRNPRKALLLATAAVFLATWLLHAYQWFWLTGSWLFAWNDTLFWLILGALVMADVGASHFVRGGASHFVGGTEKGASHFVRVARGMRIAATFTVIAVLWSMWSSDSLGQWLHLWTVAPALAPALVAAVVALYAGAPAVARLGRRDAARPRTLPAVHTPFWRTGAVTAAGAAGLLALATPAVHARLGSGVAELAAAVTEPGLSARDARVLERGYYERLLAVGQRNPELRELYTRRPAHWRRIEETELWRTREDFLLGELAPGAEMRFKGAELTVNRWGMRDRFYPLEKPPGTLRMALLGSSHAMGSGVADDEVFEARYEARWNASERRPLELLSFAVAGHAVPQDLYTLEHEALAFDPDVVLVAGHTHDVAKIERYLARVLRRRIEVPWSGLTAIVERAGARPGDAEAVNERLLRRHRWELLEWCYRRMAERIEAAGAAPVWLFLPLLEGDREGDVARMFQVAADAGFHPVDLRPAYAGHPTADLRLAPWDLHPNPRAHRLLAEELWRALGPEEVAALVE